MAQPADPQVAEVVRPLNRGIPEIGQGGKSSGY